MAFNLESVPAVLHRCEMHGKFAKRSEGEHVAPTREKEVTLSLDVTDKRFASILDECWPGADHLIKAMAGADSSAQDLVSHRKMPSVRLRVFEVDGQTEVFAIGVARSKGRPTLRIAPRAAKVQLVVKVVGPIASTLLKTIDEHCEADVYVDIGAVQTTVGDFIDGQTDDGEPSTTTLVKAGGKRTTRRAHLQVAEHVADFGIEAESA